MKQKISEFIAAGVFTFAMVYSVVYCATESGIKGWIYFALFLIAFSSAAAILESRRNKAQRAKTRKIVWNA